MIGRDQSLRISAPSALLVTLMQRFTQTCSERMNEIVARGIYGVRIAALLKAQQEVPVDAGGAELATAGEQPADRAEAVFGA